jgi:hypothetical protein
MCVGRTLLEWYCGIISVLEREYELRVRFTDYAARIHRRSGPGPSTIAAQPNILWERMGSLRRIPTRR